MRFFNTTSTAWLVCCAVVVTASLLTHHASKTNQSATYVLNEEEGKSADKPGPNELFLLDRNYPGFDPSPAAYKNLLSRSIAYDRKQTASGRDLDFPWRMEGPGNIGGRINAVAVHPTDPDIMLLGYSQGGIWRTTDNGQNWSPVFDDQPSLSIANIVFDPHNASHMWAATGDVNISGYYWLGTGVYESHDTGLTWQYKGLADTGVLSKVAVDPNDPEIIYVGSMGFPAQKGNQRGLFRSTNGGDSWEKVLTIDDSTGIIDLVTDPTKPGRLFASSWTRIRSNIKGLTVGPGTGLYKSEDYGANWQNITATLPDGEHSRTGVEITNDGILFLSYVGNSNSFDCGTITEDLRNIYKSVDNGLSWDTVPASPFHGLPCVVLGGFGWYFEYMKVNPNDPLDICILGVSMFRTRDGGMTWFEATPDWPVSVHADKHDLIFAHDQLFLGTDGGAYRTDIDQIDVWVDMELIPSTQYYRTAWNPHTPTMYYGGAQDNGTSGGNEGIFNEWAHLFGGDGFQPRFDREDSLLRYVLTQNGNVWFSNDGGFDFQWLGFGLNGTRYWDMPLLMDVENSKVLFCGSDRVYKINMSEPELEWSEISPDLTRGEFILGDRYPAITALAQSPLDTLRLYAGTQDGLIWTTDDGGENWTNITAGTPEFFVTSISCSTINPEGVYATYSGYRDNNHQPYIYKSNDAGNNWLPIQTDLPMMGVNDLFIVPDKNDAILLAGTDGGVYASIDGADTWSRVGNNMPYMPVYDIDINPVEDRIIAATFSRGIMTFPVEELELETGVEQSASAMKGITVYPTVFDDELNIDVSGMLQSANEIQIELISSAGQVVFTSLLNRENKISKLAIPPFVSSGVYFLHLNQKDGSVMHKVVKP